LIVLGIMRTRHGIWARASLISALAGIAALLSGCAATSVLSFAYEQANEGECVSAGCAASAMLSYALGKATEGDPTPCNRLNSVERALNARCGVYQAGSLLTKDVTASGLPQCPLSLAARDPKLWPMLPELLSKGAMPEVCDQPPLVALAQASPCPDFSAASDESLRALRWLAEADTRVVHHDVMRMLSCPAARNVGLNTVLDSWLAQGQLPSRGLTFGALSALHPDYLNSDFARGLEAQGHTARAGLGAYSGRLPSGFDVALRDGNVAALDWWLDRVPDLANRVPPRQANQLAWIPLVRVLTPTYLAKSEQQPELVSYLLSRGADPLKSLPHDPGRTVINYAQQLKSPSLALLETPQRVAASGSVAKVSTALVGAAAAPMSAP
jgi:hypothetical protein